MFCGKCGTLVQEGNAFCTNCGNRVVPAEQQPEQPTGQQSTYQTPPTYQQANPQKTAYSQPTSSSSTYSSGNTTPYYATAMYDQPMNWFHFLIYFGLFAEAVSIAASGLFCISNNGNKWVDVLFGVICLGIAALKVYVRFRLAGHYEDGPKLLCLSYILEAVVTCLYSAVELAVIDDIPFLVGVLFMGIGSAVCYVLPVVLNKIYFDKRSHLFYY